MIDENLSMWWKLIPLLIYENSTMDKIYHFDNMRSTQWSDQLCFPVFGYSSLWMELITVITFMNVYHCGDNLVMWWKFGIIVNNDKNSSLWWRFIILINNCDENFSFWWKFLIVSLWVENSLFIENHYDCWLIGLE